jgi:DNA-binding transcriptional ArsR family regulator
MELIDRIRRDIQERLDALLGEADKLRKALIALDHRSVTSPARQPTRKRAPTRSTVVAPPGATRRRTPPGATRRRVLEALSDGTAKTAGEVASETGVARGTVSTTLSKLVRTGDVVKAERGYRLPDSSTRASAPAPGSAGGPS